MAIIFIRSLIIYVTLLILLRLMGKRQIGEMQPFEFVVTLLIAELACIPMADISIPLLYGLSAMLAVFILHQILTIFEQTGTFFKVLVSGKPSIVINKNGVDFKELKRNNVDVGDLIESMRSLGYFSLENVSYAIYESNGKLSAIESENPISSKSLPILLINNGKMDKKNCELLNIDKVKLQKIVESLKIKSVKNVGVFTIDGDYKYYIQEFGKKFLTGTINLKGGAKW